jgi:hypothetical protein
MEYMVALEDGEIVKKTANGFISTGMFILPIGDVPLSLEPVQKNVHITANA